MTINTNIIIFSLLAVVVSAFIVLRVIPSYINNRRRVVEKEMEQAEVRNKKYESDRTEQDRKVFLEKNDSKVDQIIENLICAKLDLQHILRCIDDFTFTPDNLSQINKWTNDHQEVADFYVFRQIMEYFTQHDSCFFERKEVEQLLDEHFDAGTCLEFADEKLGIHRNYEYWDGENCGGVRYEKANGRYEDINARFDRILRRLQRDRRG
jgi:hypothetical protein